MFSTGLGTVHGVGIIHYNYRPKCRAGFSAGINLIEELPMYAVSARWILTSPTNSAMFFVGGSLLGLVDYADLLMGVSLGLERSSRPGQLYWAIRASVVNDGYDTLGFADIAIGLAL